MKFKSIVLAFVLGLFSTVASFGQVTAIAPPPTWNATVTSTVAIATGGPTFTGWPSIVIPGIANIQHVLNCIDFTVGVTLNNGGNWAVLQVEDGLPGSTVLKAWAFVPLIAPHTVNICGLNTVGTKGNAMTIEIVPGGNYYGFLPNEYATITIEGRDYN